MGPSRRNHFCLVLMCIFARSLVGQALIVSPPSISLSFNSTTQNPPPFVQPIPSIQVTVPPGSFFIANAPGSSSSTFLSISAQSNCSSPQTQLFTPPAVYVCADTSRLLENGIHVDMITLQTLGSEVRVPVTVTVTPPSTITSAPGSVTLSSTNLHQTITVTLANTSGDSSRIGIAPPSSADEGLWLRYGNTTCPSSTKLPENGSCTIEVTADPTQLVPGVPVGSTFTNYLTITALDTGDRADVLVTFNYTQAVAQPLTITSSNSFPGAAGMPLSITLSATGGVPPYTWFTSNVLPSWLTLSSSGLLSATSAQAGTTNLSVFVRDSLGNQAGPQQIALSIQTATSTFTVSPPSISLSLNLTDLPPGNFVTPIPSVQVTVPPGASLTASAPGLSSSTFLSVSTQPDCSSPQTQLVNQLTFYVCAYLSGFTGKGTYIDMITLQSSAGEIRVPVTVTVSPASSITSAPSSVTLSSTNPQQLITVTLANILNDASRIGIAPAAPAPEGSWLSYVNMNCPSSIELPQNGSCTIDVTADPTQLVSGVPVGSMFTNYLTITALDTGDRADVMVTFNYTQAVVQPLKITSSNSFSGTAGMPLSITLSATGGAPPYTWSTSSVLPSWLTLSSSGVLSSTNAQAGMINVTISVTDSMKNQTGQQITLTIQAAQTVTTSATQMTFQYQLTGVAPLAQQLNVTSTVASVTFTASAASTGGWLGIDVTQASTPKTIDVSIDPTKIPAGTQAGGSLQGSISIAATGVLTNPITVSVTLTVIAAPAPQPVTISNSAVTNGFGPIAPGELITIKGNNLGPASPASGSSYTIDSATGGVDSTLAGVQVTFDTIAGTPTYVSATQINVIVPWEIAGRTSTTMAVVFNGVQSAPFQLPVVPVAPGIFTQNTTGSGQAVAVNLSPQAASVYNGPAGGTYAGTSLATAPAPQGSAIILYLTGGGITNPSSVTGSINPTSVLLPLNNWVPGSNVVTATIGGQTAQVLFAGAAPALITGVVQLNLQVPTGVTGDNLPVVVTIDSSTTQTTATIAVQ